MNNDIIAQMGKFILGYEARRDKQGHLAVYPLPLGDGGGTYEIAGINDKYHPKEAAVLSALIRDKNFETAEVAAADYMVKYTDAVANWSDIPAVEFFLRDCCFNRGPTGAARILQMAIGATPDGKVGPGTLEDLDEADDDPTALLSSLRKARERYERTPFPGKGTRDENSKFWAGLVNRWDAAERDAKTFPLEHVVWRQPDAQPTLAPPAKGGWPRQSGVEKFYGAVGEHQTMLVLPFPMKLAWEKNTVITKFSIHEKVHDSALACFKRIWIEYDADKRTELGLDLFGGCLNVRKMRGGDSWSMHSWGIAIDFDPDRNQLKWGRDQARLAQPDCQAFWKIWEDAGWLSLGRARDYDWMHVQAAVL